MTKTPSLSALKIVSLAIHFSVLIYVFIIFILARSQAWDPASWGEMIKPENEILVYVLIALSGIMFFISLMAPQFFRSKNSQASGEGNLILNFSEFTPHVYTLTILRLALAESIAIFGFVLAFLNQSPWLIVPFALVSMALQVVVGPWIKKKG